MDSSSSMGSSSSMDSTSEIEGDFWYTPKLPLAPNKMPCQKKGIFQTRLFKGLLLQCWMVQWSTPKSWYLLYKHRTADIEHPVGGWKILHKSWHGSNTSCELWRWDIPIHHPSAAQAEYPVLLSTFLKSTGLRQVVSLPSPGVAISKPSLTQWRWAVAYIQPSIL